MKHFHNLVFLKFRDLGGKILIVAIHRTVVITDLM